MSDSTVDSFINVHPLTQDPTTVWKQIKNKQKVLKIQPPIPKGPVGDNKVCTYYITLFITYNPTIYKYVFFLSC